MKILNFGSLNIDNVYAVDHFIRPGETMSTGGMEIFCGGKGLNQSIALAKAGAEVYHAGAVGNRDGERLLAALAAAGVDTAWVRRTKGVSGHTVIQVDPSGQNCILLYGGANREITEQQIDETLAHFESGDLLLLQNEINGLPYLMNQAKKRGMKIYLNPSPVTKELFEMPLELTDCFILNEIEAADLCESRGSRVGLPQEEQYPELLHGLFPQAEILLTLGSKGSRYFNGAKRVSQEAFAVKAVDTTAAGDTFTGYFIAAQAEGRSLPDCLRRASGAAALAVTRKGASVSIPEAAEVECFLTETERVLSEAADKTEHEIF